MDGIEVLKRIRKVDNDIAVVIFTGFPNLESAVASMKLDAVDYIKKPFNVDEFREVLARVMRKKGLARTPEEQLHRVIGDTIRNLRKDKDLTLSRWRGAPGSASRCSRRSSGPSRRPRSRPSTRSRWRSSRASRISSASTDRSGAFGRRGAWCRLRA